MAEQTETEIDRLYELPLDEFTAARDELAARLRRADEGDAAAEVKRLRKPSVAAWALNQVRRSDPDKVDKLIEAGRRLREAQESVLAGAGRETLDRASVEERELVTDLARHAERELVAAGRKVSAAVQERLRETLDAAATDDEARDGLVSGRLLRDHAPSGVWPLAGAVTPRRTKKAKEDPATREAERLASRLERAKAKHEKLEQEVSDACDRVREARAEAARAASTLERAEAAEDQARRQVEQARSEVEDLESAIRELAGSRRRS